MLTIISSTVATVSTALSSWVMVIDSEV